MVFRGPNTSEKWRRWRQAVELYLDLSMADKDEKDKYKSFFMWLGKMVGISITQWYLWDETNKISVLFQKFENYSKPKQNITVERYKFNTRVQSNTESIDQYVTEIRLIAKKLPFKHSRERTDSRPHCVWVQFREREDYFVKTSSHWKKPSQFVELTKRVRNKWNVWVKNLASTRWSILKDNNANLSISQSRTIVHPCGK